MEYSNKLKKSLFNIQQKSVQQKTDQWIKQVSLTQAISIIMLLATGVLYFFLGELLPDFNLSELWVRTDNIWQSVSQYWYLPLWGIVLSSLVGEGSRYRSVEKVRITIIAGIWEEIGYRGLFIATAIVGIMLSNFLFEWFLVIGLTIFILWMLASIGPEGRWLKIILLLGLTLPLGYLVITSEFGANPVYWIYENIWFKLWSFISFGMLDSILYNPEFSPLFIMGATSANAAFRDGHKYQGPIGFLNSWVAGFIFLHAMMFHGIVVAIILHISYNLMVQLVTYIKGS